MPLFVPLRQYVDWLKQRQQWSATEKSLLIEGDSLGYSNA